MRFHVGDLDFARALIQIGVTKKGNYLPKGSGFLYFDGNLTYLVTAAHVMRDVKLTHPEDYLTITSEGYTFYLGTAKYVDSSKTSFSEEIKGKIIDFALLPVPDNLLDTIFDKSKDILILQNELIGSTSFSEHDYYMSAYGFPYSQNRKQVDSTNRYGGLRSPQLLQLTGVPASHVLRNEKAFLEGIHVAMGTSKMGVDDFNNSKKIPLLNGMSGGLMTINYIDSNHVKISKAVGVISDLSRKKDAIVGISFDFLKVFIDCYMKQIHELKAEMENRFKVKTQ